MTANLEPSKTDANGAVWYLGLDLGTTGISAVLLDSSTGHRYPIYWLQAIPSNPKEWRSLPSQFPCDSSSETTFRLPTVIYSGPATKQLFDSPIPSIVVGSLASKLANHQPGILLENFKPYLNSGIPYYCSKRHEWEPILQLPNQQLVSLYWIRRALQALLATLMPSSTLPDSLITMGAQGLESEALATALQQLEGVIFGCPAAWGDTYRFNLREAVLDAKFVHSPEQIFFLEDAIASLLAILPSFGSRQENALDSGQRKYDYTDKSNFSESSSHVSPSPRPPIPPSSLSGGTLVINLGATTTEIALVNLPDDLQELTYSDFNLYSLPYAGNAIDLDIFCQLLYPQLSAEQQQQLALPDDFEWPQPGQPDTQKRDRLTLLLQHSPFGQAFFKATSYIKVILQHKEQFTLALDNQPCTLTRRDLETKVVLPFIQHLNQNLRTLMIETGISEPGISQVFLLGGTANVGLFAKWIQQRLPNATLIQGVDLPEESWVAAGLAMLPLYPQVLNYSRQQYSEYFLLLELLRAFPETSGEAATHLYSLEEILQQLEHRGLNTGAFYERLVRLVDGQLPVGLVPSLEELSLISPTSKENKYYTKLAASTGIFSQEGDGLYRRNLQQQECLREYLELVLAGTHQKFEEPLMVLWSTSI